MPTDEAPESAAQALARARMHAQRAVGEALLAARALLDAASLGWSGRPSDAHNALRTMTGLLDEQAARFTESGAGVPAPVLKTLLAALDHEIARWERQAASDAEARAVLRTFLGLREILWEFGLRPESDPEAPTARARPQPTRTRRPTSNKKPAPSRRGRVQRVDVKG